jgi:hypothetical protein
MKLGQNLFKKDQSIWGKPIIEYDQSKMNELFSEIRQTESNGAKSTLPLVQRNEISLETELYLMLHS